MPYHSPKKVLWCCTYVDDLTVNAAREYCKKNKFTVDCVEIRKYDDCVIVKTKKEIQYEIKG